MGQEDKVGDAAIDQNRINTIRASTTDTRELVRAMATYLFLECGIHPSANKILSLTKQGSMNTITDELANWWDSLRERMRPTIAAPDVPEALRDTLAEFGAQFWIAASADAKATFEGERARLEGLAESAGRQAEDAITITHKVRVELAEAHEDKHKLHLQLEKRDNELTEAHQSVSMLRGEVERRTQENRETQDRLSAAQNEFTKELDKQRETTAKIEHRAAEDLRRQHQEVDRARQETLRKAEELTKLKEAAERAAAAAQAAQVQASQAQAALEQRLAKHASDRAVSETAMQATIKGLETQLSMTVDVLDNTKKALAAGELREQSLSDELRAMRVTLDRVLAERAVRADPETTATTDAAPASANQPQV
jgi:hypothetical protein